MGTEHTPRTKTELSWYYAIYNAKRTLN